jgi:hypothetical protein
MPAQAGAPDGREEILYIDLDPEIRLTRDFNAFYSAIAADEGFVHAVTSHAAGMEPFYVRSTDQGYNWSEQVRLVDTTGITSVYPFLFADSNFVTMPFSGNGVIRCVYSNDFGQTWSSWRRTYIQGYGYSAARLDTTLYIVFPVDVHNMECYTSINHGASWQYHSTKRNLEGESALGATPTALHMIVEAGMQEIFYCQYPFTSQAWGDTVRLSDNPREASFDPEMTAWGDSNLAVIWVDYKYSPYSWTGDILMRRSTDNGNSWLPEQQLTFNHLAFGKNITQRNDSLFMVYDEIVIDGATNTEEIFFNLSTDGGVNWDEPIRLTYSPWRSIYPSIAVEGQCIHIAYCDARDDTVWGIHNSLYYRRGTITEVGIENESPTRPEEISLQAYPNPFNSSTIITYTNYKGGDISIGIYDVQGRLIKTLKTGEIGGEKKIVWDATDAHSKKVNSGIYFAKALTPQNEKAIKLLLVK